MTTKFAWLLFVLPFLAVTALRADQVQMQNGDRYVGKIISMSAETVVLQSEMLGRIKLPREHVAAVTMGAPPVTPLPVGAVVVAPSNASPDISAALRQLGGDTNLVEQVRKQFLNGASPEANAKFNDLMSGLMTGKVDMNALRAQAKDAVDQLRALKSQGADPGEPLDSYLGILEGFLKEAPAAPTPAATPAVTNTNSPYGSIIIR